MLKIFGAGPSRWVKPYWTASELELPFEPVKISLQKGEQLKPEFLALNPFAKVPAMQDGDFSLFESAAICSYLADKHPDRGLIPRAGTRERGLHDQWVSFVISDLEQPLWRITRHRFIYPEATRSPAEVELAIADFNRLATGLEKQLRGAYLVDGRFSVADIAMTYTLKWATLPAMPRNLLTPFPRLAQYMSTHAARPKFPRDLYPAPATVS